MALLTGLAQASEPAALSTARVDPSARWETLKSYAAAMPEARRVGHVNEVFNDYTYRTDMEMHGVPDYWDTPQEFVERGAGDCEDFAIAKYFLLIESGVSPDRVKLAFVHFTGGAGASLGADKPAGSRAHVVVLYRDPAHATDPLVLDLIDDVLPLSMRDDLKVVFDFDLRATYQQWDRTVATAAVERKMSKWVDVLQRGNLVARAGSLRVASRGAPAPVVAAHTNGTTKVALR